MFYANGQKGKAEAKTNWPYPTVVEVTKLVREVSYLYTDSITYLLTNCINPDMNIGKAFASALYKQFKVSLPEDTKAKIGSLLSAVPDDDTEIVLTLGCEGSARDYYHPDSCWWGRYDRSRDVLEHNGGGALRAYNEDGTLIGRAWFLPYEDWIAVFNCYGDGNLQHAQTWASLINKAFGWYAEVVKTDDFSIDVTYEDLYVNDAAGIVVGTKPCPRKKVHVKPDVNAPPIYTKHTVRCAICDHRVRETDVTEIHSPIINLPRGNLVCTGCFTTYITTVSSGSYAGQLALSGQLVRMSNRTYYYEDPEVYQDSLGLWCFTKDAIKVNGTLYAPDNVLTDVYGNFHAQGTHTWRRCYGCRKIFPAYDPHLTEDCNEN